MTGGHDPLNRGAMVWDSGSWDTDLLHEFQRLVAFRKATPAVRRGSYHAVYAHENVYGYLRQLGDETVLVVLNVSRGTRRVDVCMESFLPDGTILKEAWGTDAIRVEQSTLRDLRLNPRSGRVFTRATMP
jgi:glycosidase